jgi:hypothetical protein
MNIVEFIKDYNAYLVNFNPFFGSKNERIDMIKSLEKLTSIEKEIYLQFDFVNINENAVEFGHFKI